MERIILIDGNPLMWRAAYSKNESFVKEGIITYFFDILDNFDCNKCLVFWDSGKSRWRTSAYKEYKASRDIKKKEFDLALMSEQREEAKTILEHFGVRNITVPGVEADDLISWFSEFFSDDYSVVIASRDKDLWQLVKDNVSIYDPLSSYYTEASDVKEALGIPSYLVPDLKALVGDVSDNIKGVKGVGEKTAVGLLSKYGSLSKILSVDNSKDLKKKKTTSRILDQVESLDHSYKLVKLPSYYDMSVFLNADEKDVLEKELTKPDYTNSMKAQVEMDRLSNSRIVRRYVSSDFDFSKFIEAFRFHRGRTLDVSIMENLLPKCAYCSLGTFSQSRLFPKGPLNSNIMVLGSNLVGDSSDFLDGLFSEISVPREKCWVTNTTKCYTGNCPVEYSHLEMCKEFFKTEVRDVDPKMIITLGSDALSFVTPFKSHSLSHVGEINKFVVEEKERWIAVLPDPMYILRDTNKKADWDFGVSRIKQFLDERRKK